MAQQFKFFEGDTSANDEAQERLEGFTYRQELIGHAEEEAIIACVRELPFQEFDFHGYKGKRRVVSFGWQYEFAGGGQLRKADEIPEFLLPLRAHAARFAGHEPDHFQHVLVTEYGPGAGIGWHRDKAVFGEVVGISLMSECVLRFRRKINTATKRRGSDKVKWERVNVLTEPRSAYHLTGLARWEWEHSIVRVEALRYAITFRTLQES